MAAYTSQVRLDTFTLFILSPGENLVRLDFWHILLITLILSPGENLVKLDFWHISFKKYDELYTRPARGGGGNTRGPE
jgi:hypothetical protein